MFRIDKLILISDEEKEYIYSFSSGINYFQGSNDTGKTEFYEFLDYMFGRSEQLDLSKEWYEHLSKAILIFTYNDISYAITRTKNPDCNYFEYLDEKENEGIIPLRVYNERLNSVFGINKEIAENIKEFTGENDTFRIFTMFNFLGETRQGVMNDFFDKCSRVEYKLKLYALLDLIFNKNISEIMSLEKELEQLTKEIKDLEKTEFKYEYINNQISDCINILGLGIVYDGTNKKKILNKLEGIKQLNSIQKKKSENIIELEYLFNHINEQIKVYENAQVDINQIDIANKNRELLLENLNEIINDNPDFEYMVTPIKETLNEVKKSISLTNYLITDKTIMELRKRRKEIKQELDNNRHYSRLYDLNEKERACALLENFLKESECTSSLQSIKEKRSRLTEIRKKLIILKKSQDNDKIKKLSEHITNLYKEAKSSNLVNIDMLNDGFNIKYFKSGNSLQTFRNETIKEDNIEKIVEVSYSKGSMARHTLIQLAGYLGFLQLLLSENKYPIIPFLVIDHISKPFDTDNRKGIGEILNNAISIIGENNLQVILFDDKNHEELSLEPNKAECLVSNTKTGFIPFFVPNDKEETDVQDSTHHSENDK